jgi:hypothetical protein
MDPVTKDRKTNTPPDISVSSDAIAPSNESRQLEQTGVGTFEPNVWRTLGRLSHEFIVILAIIFIHWFIKLWSAKTQEENDWLVIFLIYAIKVFAAIAFPIIFGAELIADCKQAVQYAIRRFREK